MLLDAIARQVETVVQPVFYGVDMSGGMLLYVLNDLSGILFQMIGIFDECFASAGNGVIYHIYEIENTPGINFSYGVYTPCRVCSVFRGNIRS